MRMDRPNSGSAPAPKIGQLYSIEEDNGRKLVWEPVPGEFHIYDPITKSREPIRPRHATDSGAPREPEAAAIENGEGTDPTVPSQRLKHDVLEAALQAGYDGVVSQLLERYGGMNHLNVHVSVGELPRQTSPLEWATEQENVLAVVRDFGHYLLAVGLIY